MSSQKVFYLHTIGAKAAYYDGEQIVYSTTTRPARLALSLDQIRREQRASARWRKATGDTEQGRAL